MEKFQKVIHFLFGTLFLLVPLVLWPFNSEAFEFNKIVLTYALTTLIVSAWIIRSVVERKIIFRRTILDIPLVVFLFSQLISTIFSIDPRTSFFGYYSRFNGGLLSLVCYSILYWAFVSNISKDYVKKILLIILSSGVIVASIGILEHTGFFPVCAPINLYQIRIENNENKITEFNNLTPLQKFGLITRSNCWKQDVKERVFSTIGQPNWLAAYLILLLPLTWSGLLKKKFSYILSFIFFLCLLFTKSRSGLLGFIVADIVFWGYMLWKHKKEHIKDFLIHNSIYLILFLVIGNPLLPSILKTSSNNVVVEEAAVGTVLETGGTESGTIRKIVWKGALDVWKHNPIIGTGVETFAYSYYKFRPVEHNLVSEWAFTYNKAHNEYLNFAANTGSLGLLSYLYLLGMMLLVFIKKRDSLDLALGFGVVGLLISNFFGFSIVLTNFLLFLFPAFAIAFSAEDKRKENKKEKIDQDQKIIILTIILLSSSLLYLISRYWHADLLFWEAREKNQKGDVLIASKLVGEAIEISPSEPLYHMELSESYTQMALILNESEDKKEVPGFLEKALSEGSLAVNLSSSNINLKREFFRKFIKLSPIDRLLLIEASQVLEKAIIDAPTDPRLFYDLGLTYARMGKRDEAIAISEKLINLKPNYKEGRILYALLLIDKGEREKAKTELEYILSFIDPNDPIAKQNLEEIK